MADAEQVKEAAEAYIYGYPLVYDLKAVADAVNGWTSALHLFDYNLDRLGLGTIDAPEWKIPDRQRAYVSRAVAARGGLWGNHGYEANSPGPGKEANWLPTPAGAFRPVMRMYQPQQAVLDGTYLLPPVRKVG